MCLFYPNTILQYMPRITYSGFVTNIGNKTGPSVCTKLILSFQSFFFFLLNLNLSWFIHPFRFYFNKSTLSEKPQKNWKRFRHVTKPASQKDECCVYYRYGTQPSSFNNLKKWKGCWVKLGRKKYRKKKYLKHFLKVSLNQLDSGSSNPTPTHNS